MANKVEIVFTARNLTGAGFRGVRLGLARATSGVKGLSRHIFSLKGLIAGAGILALGKSFINAADTTEQLNTRLTVLLGSVSEGNRLFKDMTQFASEVPFEFEEIMSSATQLAGIMRGGVDEINEWIPLIGDLAATSGLSIQKTTEQVSRMLSGGAAAADLFRERGITAMLGFEAGVAVSVGETRKRLMNAWKDPLSKFRGATDLLAKTWSGVLSMIADKWFAIRTTIMDAGLMDFIKAIAMSIDDDMGDALTTTKKDAEEWVNSFISLVESIVIGAASMFDSIMPYLKRLSKSINDLWAGFQSLPTWAKEVGIIGALMGGKKGVAALTAMAKFSSDFKTTGAWWAAYAEGHIGFAEWVMTGHDKAKETLEGIQLNLTNIRDIANAPITSGLSDVFNQVSDSISKLGGEGLSISKLLIPDSGELSGSEATITSYFEMIRGKMEEMRKQRAGASGGNGSSGKSDGYFDWDEFLEETQQGLEAQNALVMQSLFTDRETFNIEYENRILALENFYMSSEMTDEEYRRNKELLNAQHNENIAGTNKNAIQGSFDFGEAMRKREFISAAIHAKGMVGVIKNLGKGIFKLTKTLALAQAVISLPAAVMESFKNGGGYPWGLIPAALMTARGLSEIQTIRSTNMAHSGITSVARDSTFELQAGERVIRRDQNRDLTNFLEGGSGGGGGGVNIENFHMTLDLSAHSLRDMDSTEFQELLADKFIPGLDALADQGVRLQDFTGGEAR